MSDAVLPGGEPVLVVGEPVPDELTDAMQGESLVRRLNNGHGDQSNVGVRWLHPSTSLCLDVILSVLIIDLLFITSLFLVTLFKLSLVK